MVALGDGAANAAPIYANDFEANLAGTTSGGVTAGPLTPGGTLAGKTLVNASLGLLAPDSGTANNTNWLANYDNGSSGATNGLGWLVNKTTTADETISLTLSGLTAGTRYDVDFDLIIRSSWDGAAGGGLGPDRWYFAVNGTRLVDTIFSNGNNGAFPDPSPANVGAYSPQRYADTFFASPGVAANDVNRFTGADALRAATNYPEGYGIYWFGHGVGNPDLNFLATSSTATLVWARSSAAADSNDENWSIDNVSINVVPEPTVASVALFGIGGIALRRKRLPLS
jgi:hypothetical protein